MPESLHRLSSSTYVQAPDKALIHFPVLRNNRDMLDFVSALGFESAPSRADEHLVRITKQL